MAVIRAIVEAHRGGRVRHPENTRVAFLAALRAGVDAIEVDVGLTRDGVVVVCHDSRLDPALTRIEGAWIAPPGPLLRELTLAELRQFDVGRARPGSATAIAFPDQVPADGSTVPTLAEVVALARLFPARLEVELKSDPGRPDETAAPDILADAILAVASPAALGRATLGVRSFDWRGLEHLRERAPGVPRSWLTEAETEAAPALWWNRAGTVPDLLEAGETWAPDHRTLTPARLRAAHAQGVRVVPWTVNAPAAIAELLAWGVDGVCTDDPWTALAMLGR